MFKIQSKLEIREYNLKAEGKRNEKKWMGIGEFGVNEERIGR